MRCLLATFLSIVFACDGLVRCSLRGHFVYMFKTISPVLLFRVSVVPVYYFITDGCMYSVLVAADHI